MHILSFEPKTVRYVFLCGKLVQNVMMEAKLACIKNNAIQYYYDNIRIRDFSIIHFHKAAFRFTHLKVAIKFCSK